MFRFVTSSCSFAHKRASSLSVTLELLVPRPPRGTSSGRARKWALSSFSSPTAPAPRHARSELGRRPEALPMDVLSGVRELLAASEQYEHHSRRRHSGVLWVAVHIGTCGLSRPLAGRASFVLGWLAAAGRRQLHGRPHLVRPWTNSFIWHAGRFGPCAERSGLTR